jgi:hypothetical protein
LGEKHIILQIEQDILSQIIRMTENMRINDAFYLREIVFRVISIFLKMFWKVLVIFVFFRPSVTSFWAISFFLTIHQIPEMTFIVINLFNSLIKITVILYDSYIKIIIRLVINSHRRFKLRNSKSSQFFLIIFKTHNLFHLWMVFKKINSSSNFLDFSEQFLKDGNYELA